MFFAVTKLFQSENTALRRMTYLFIKEVAESTDPENVIIVIQSLTKDMNSKVELYRANAIRVLCKIIDASILGQIDRYIKQAVVDRDPLVSASALISANQMARDPEKREVVRRWANEVTESVNSRSEMVQFHALALLYAIKAHDRLAIGRIVGQYSKGALNSPLAMCLLVRYTSKLLQDDVTATNARSAYEFLENCLHHKNEMVIYEAARAMCRLPEVAAQDIMPAVTVLQLFLGSPKPALRFAAVRTLNEVAMKHPTVVVRCNEDMEALIGDANKSIATLAITTLLKTGSEHSIDKLMKQIAAFITDIADEYKIVVVRAVRGLCTKYPSKQRVMLNFLSNILREEGGFEFKKVIVDSIMAVIDKMPAAKEAGLFHLCEFIEDCEFNLLSSQILHILGEQGPTTAHPAKFIRFIYNRVILENAQIRAAAVSALGKFGSRVPGLTGSISMLLQQSLEDEDDEVRDRATVCLAMLARVAKGGAEADRSRTVLVDPLPMHFNSLARSLAVYEQHPAPGPLSFDTLPVVEDADDEGPSLGSGMGSGMGSGLGAAGGGGASGGGGGVEGGDAEAHMGLGAAAGEGGAAAGGGPSGALSREDGFAAELFKVPEFAALGPLFKSSRPVELTESEMEYLVSCVKHVFAEHVVFQFTVTNTLEDQLLKDVSVALEEPDNEAWEVLLVKPVALLKFNAPKKVYVLARRPTDAFDASFVADLKFNILECEPGSGEPLDPDEEGDEEEVPLELTLGVTDFIAKVQVHNFKSTWEAVGKENELVAKFELPHKTLRDAISAVVDFLGLRPCEGTDVVAHNADAQNVLLSGTFIGNSKVLARTAFSIAPSGSSINLKIAVRAETAAVAQLVMDCI